MDTPAQQFEKYLKDLLAKFNKSPYRLPVAIALITGFSYLTMLYLSGNCLSSLFVPLFMLVIFWLFEYKRVRNQMLAGGLTCPPITEFTDY